jgi:hypothetical protein
MSPRDAYEAGELEVAVRLQAEVVAVRPNDAAAGMFLFELLALTGRLRDACRQLMAVEVQTTPLFRASQPKALFPINQGGWDVAPDGKRFASAGCHPRPSARKCTPAHLSNLPSPTSKC